MNKIEESDKGAKGCYMDVQGNIYFLSGKTEKHEHAEIELIYVIEGQCAVNYREQRYILGQKDFILFNSVTEHEVSVEKDSISGVIHYDFYEICRLLQEDYLLFQCNSITGHGKKYTELEKLIKELLANYVIGDNKRLFYVNGQYQILMSNLVSDFKLGNFAVSNMKDWEDSQKLAMMKGYIHRNYMEGATLTELADMMYMSVSALSRYFQKQTGISFAKYLRQYRLGKVVEEIVMTEKPITRIALDHGYGTASALDRDFREEYGMSPKKYREEHKEKHKEKPAVQEEDVIDRDRLREVLQLDEAKKGMSGSDHVIGVDCSALKEYKRWNLQLVNVGEVSSLLQEEMQEHVLIFKKMMGIEYVRLWSLFSEDMMITEDGRHFNFHYVDHVLDFLVNNELKLFLDMGQRTKAARSSENKLIYHKETGILFRSEEEWIRMLEHFFRHINRRYGERHVKEWIFEFTFFLNERPYYESQNYSARRVWKTGAEILRRECPSSSLAGPGLMAGTDQDMMDRLISSFLENEIKPDLFTSYNFPYDGITDENALHKVSNQGYLQAQIEAVRDSLETCGYQGRYAVTDWNNSIANRNYIQDSCYRGTFVMKNVLDNYASVDMLGIFYASDLLNIYYDSDQILSGSGGYLTRDGIPKPAFYALLFLQDTGQHLLEKGENYLITANDSDHIFILCYNDKSLGVNYYLSEEDSYRPREIDKLFIDQDRTDLYLNFQNIEHDGSYTVTQRILNNEKGSIWGLWSEMKFEKDLHMDVVEYLKQVCVPEMTLEHVHSVSGRMQMKIAMEPHEMRWIEIKKD